MKFEDNYEESNNMGTAVAVGVSLLAIAVVLFVVFYFNSDSVKRKSSETSISVSTENSIASIGDIISNSGVYVSDLDFYDMYKDRDSGDGSDEENDTRTQAEEPVEEINESNDGKHTYITDYDGSGEWVPISQYITKHDYDFMNLIDQSGRYKYFDNDKCVSSFGVDISKDQGYVDFNKLKKAGADYVMIRVGQRGYKTGNLSEDEYFKDSIKRANDAGLSVGVYFLSQAVNEDEAREEADFVIERIKDYKIEYPVAFVMKYADNDSSRVETLTRKNKTLVAEAFLKKIDEAGYNSIIYGDKTWLIRYLDLSKLVNDYDIWLTQTDVETPDYPYKFSMWQYSKAGTIDGISGYVNFNISFLDYSLK